MVRGGQSEEGDTPALFGQVHRSILLLVDAAQEFAIRCRVQIYNLQGQMLKWGDNLQPNPIAAREGGSEGFLAFNHRGKGSI